LNVCSHTRRHSIKHLLARFITMGCAAGMEERPGAEGTKPMIVGTKTLLLPSEEKLRAAEAVDRPMNPACIKSLSGDAYKDTGGADAKEEPESRRGSKQSTQDPESRRGSKQSIQSQRSMQSRSSSVSSLNSSSSRAKWHKISAVKPDKKGINLMVKCISCEDIQAIGRQTWEAVIGDDTGIVTLQFSDPSFAQLCFRSIPPPPTDAQIRLGLADPADPARGPSLSIRNAKALVVTKGLSSYLRLVVDKLSKGDIEVAGEDASFMDDKSWKVNTGKDVSGVDYSKADEFNERDRVLEKERRDLLKMIAEHYAAAQNLGLPPVGLNKAHLKELKEHWSSLQ